MDSTYKNVEVLRKIKKDREVINTVKKRKLQYLGHLMRNEQRFYLFKSILQRKVLGKRGTWATENIMAEKFKDLVWYESVSYTHL